MRLRLQNSIFLKPTYRVAYMDLTKYGIKKRLVDGSTRFTSRDLAPAHVTQDGVIFVSGSYAIMKQLGSGTYGKTYEIVSDVRHARYALKSQVYKTEDDVHNIVLEAIMNSIAETTSANEPHGPYVQRLYEIGIDRLHSIIFIRTQLLAHTIEHLLEGNTLAENDVYLPYILLQLSTILDFFQKKLHMNHRDIKSSNIMYELVNGIPRIKLIDFGYACMTYKGIFLSQGKFPNDKDCLRKGRDISLLLLELLIYFSDKISTRTYAMLKSLATFQVHGKTYLIDKFRPSLKIRKWRNSYTFLNRANVENPHTTPKYIRRVMTHTLKTMKAKVKAKANKTRRRRRVD